MKQGVAILGSTGSIGQNTLAVLSKHPERFAVFALTAFESVQALFVQCMQYQPRFAVMGKRTCARQLRERLQAQGANTIVLEGIKALNEVATHPQSHIVMAAIVGAAGLPACMAAAQAGKRLLLANKEALVVGAQLFMQTVARGKATLLPIDSEHSAIFQSLPNDSTLWQGSVEKIVLTASGGPFRTWQPAQLAGVTPEQAVAHPNWNMGQKISVDSATMMNKALEVIEARYLFGLQPQQIEVCIHPQSIVHSMVQYLDGSVLAQLGSADMRAPIAYGLSWPERIASGAPKLDFTQQTNLVFEPVNTRLFPGLALAWETLAAPAGSTCVLNAANEIAVQAFLERRLRFDQIHHLSRECLTKLCFTPPESLGALLELDAAARACAHEQLRHLTH